MQNVTVYCKVIRINKLIVDMSLNLPGVGFLVGSLCVAHGIERHIRSSVALTSTLRAVAFWVSGIHRRYDSLVVTRLCRRLLLVVHGGRNRTALGADSGHTIGVGSVGYGYGTLVAVRSSK